MGSIRDTFFSIVLVSLFSIAAYAIDPPIAYWKMDNVDGKTATEEISGLDGELVGPAVWAQEGRYGGAVECIDDSSFVEIPGSDGIFDDLGTDFTLCAWVKVYEFSSEWLGILSKNDRLFFETNNSSGNGTVNGIHFKCKDETGAQPFNLYGDITIDDGEWHHIVGIYNTDIAYLYVDAELDKEGPASGELVGYVDDPLIIGGKFEGIYKNSWNGLIDEVRIYDYAMTPAQVVELYNLSIDDTRIDSNSGRLNDYQLDQNYPNPFNPSTAISFTLPQQAHVAVEVYNTLGQRVKTLMDQSLSMGVHQLQWDGTNAAGQSVSGGIYFYTLSSEFGVQTRKMMLIK